MADGIALEGIRRIAGAIERAVDDPDPDSRSEMMIGSMMGAVAFQKGLGVVHSLAHPLSALIDLHHGLANAIALPYGMRFNAEVPETRDRFERLATVLGTDDVPTFLAELNPRIGLPGKLSAVGVEATHLETLADLAFADFCHPSNPRPVSRADFLTLYRQAL